MYTVKTRIGMVAYDEHGEGTPLILLHANPGDHRDYDAVTYSPRLKAGASIVSTRAQANLRLTLARIDR